VEQSHFRCVPHRRSDPTSGMRVAEGKALALARRSRAPDPPPARCHRYRSLRKARIRIRAQSSRAACSVEAMFATRPMRLRSRGTTINSPSSVDDRRDANFLVAFSSQFEHRSMRRRNRCWRSPLRRTSQAWVRVKFPRERDWWFRSYPARSVSPRLRSSQIEETRPEPRNGPA
jgi:hypothetical protein